MDGRVPEMSLQMHTQQSPAGEQGLGQLHFMACTVWRCQVDWDPTHGHKAHGCHAAVMCAASVSTRCATSVINFKRRSWDVCNDGVECLSWIVHQRELWNALPTLSGSPASCRHNLPFVCSPTLCGSPASCRHHLSFVGSPTLCGSPACCGQAGGGDPPVPGDGGRGETLGPSQYKAGIPGSSSACVAIQRMFHHLQNTDMRNSIFPSRVFQNCYR
eukprot:gene23237-biopygen8842